MNEDEKLDDNNDDAKDNKNLPKDNNNNNNNNVIENKQKEKEKSTKNNDLGGMSSKDEEFDSSLYDENEDLKKLTSIALTAILVGDSNVGKTSIVNKFISGTFEPKAKCTINVEFNTKNLKIDNNLYADLKIYDTAGQEKYRALTKSYYRNADGIILVFDLTNESSFNKLNKWINDINESTKNIEIILVGNKADLINRKISKTQAENFAKENKYKYIETSAKEGTNILLLFEELASSISKKKQEESSIIDFNNLSTYVNRREELNKELRDKKEKQCC